MKVIANRAILYQGVQYKAGDTIPNYDLETLALWLKHKSVRQEADFPEEDSDPPDEKPPARRGKGG